MANPHKFQQFLQLQHVDFEPTTLIVGTFNPSWPAGNIVEWFYSRTWNNYFWDVLQRKYDFALDLRNDNPNIWKELCHTRRVAFTDMITCVNDVEKMKNTRLFLELIWTHQ